MIMDFQKNSIQDQHMMNIMCKNPIKKIKTLIYKDCLKKLILLKVHTLLILHEFIIK